MKLLTDTNIAVVNTVIEKMRLIGFKFTDAPIVIGGRAMECYGIRKFGADIDLVITNSDY